MKSKRISLFLQRMKPVLIPVILVRFLFLFSNCRCVTAGPTVLEVFNTLLKHLRMSVDFELGESSRRNSSSSVSSVRGRESDERIVQNAIIQTIGVALFYPGF